MYFAKVSRKQIDWPAMTEEKFEHLLFALDYSPNWAWGIELTKEWNIEKEKREKEKT